ncbi:MAG: PKD domain-containing protein, partial [bacterium]
TAKGYTVYRSETIAPYNWVAITDGDGDSTNTEAIDNFNLCGDTTYYKVEGWDSLGCVSLSNIDTVSHPQLFARFHTDTVCQGIPTTFTLDTLYGGIPPYTTVRWLGEEGFSAGNVDSTGYVYPSDGTKRFTFTVIDSKGCRLDILDSAIVRELPKFVVTVDSSCGPVINNFSITVNSLAPVKTIRYQGDNGQLDLQGDFNDPLFRNLKWIFLTNGGRGQFKVAVTLTDTFGCVTTDTAIVENGDPYVDILVDSTACQSTKDTLSIMPYFLTRPFNNVQWIDVTNPASPTILQSINERLPLAKVAGKRFVKLKVLIEDGKGCSGEGYVSFNLSPAVEFIPDSLCIGDPVNFDLDIANGSDTNNFTFLWELDANTVSTDRRPVHTYMSNGPKIVSLTVTDTINGCVTLIKDTLTVRNPMEFTIQVTPDCAGLPTIFTPVVISGDDTDWVWTINENPDVIPNNTISISGVRSPSVILNAGSGFFKVSLSMNDRVSGCWTTIDTVNKVFNQPDIDFDVDSINCAGQVTQFISKVVGDSGPYTYSWVGDDNFTDTVANPTHVYPNDAT